MYTNLERAQSIYQKPQTNGAASKDDESSEQAKEDAKEEGKEEEEEEKEVHFTGVYIENSDGSGTLDAAEGPLEI
ncbi:hypothetical protein LTR53_000029 [Teratosphaeriaceae sp. CCFEE 6253]|nr:hypothetical protein LTR53_000029 [Teratosphaeriaceae sp. CCFEE 6253]